MPKARRPASSRCHVGNSSTHSRKNTATKSPPKVTARLAVEAGVSMGWAKYVGDKGDTLCVQNLASAPAEDVFRDYGFTVENVVKIANGLVK